MSAQPTWVQVQDAIQSTIATASGLTTAWRFQNSPQPALDYVGLSLGAIATVGVDYVQETPVADWAGGTAYSVGDRAINDGGRTYICTTAGTSANPGTGPTGTGTNIADGSCVWAFVTIGGEIELQVGGVREVALQVEVWSGAIVEAVAEATARQTMDIIVTKLRLPLARGSLRAVGVTPFDPGPTNWIPEIVSIGFRGRASCDIRCRMPARALTEYTGYIAALQGKVDASGTADGETAVVPFVAP